MEITRIKLTQTEISFIKERIGKIKAIIIGTIEFNIIVTDSKIRTNILLIISKEMKLR